jgi:hypothetical protein
LIVAFPIIHRSLPITAVGIAATIGGRPQAIARGAIGVLP